MFTKAHIGTILIALTATASGVSAAAESPFYIGGSLGQARASFDTAGAAANVGAGVNNSDTAYKVYGGYQFNRMFGLELTYLNLGSYTATNGNTIEPAGWGLGLVGTFPISNNFSLLGRFSEYRMRQKMNPTGASDNSWSPSFGLGLKYNFDANIFARAEYERVQSMGSNTTTVRNDSNVYTIGIGYKF